VVATSISCGGMHTCCVGAHGELYAWGRADQGQLGLGRNWMQLATSRGSGGSSLRLTIAKLWVYHIIPSN
jgi:alpha-tubulin suppressor-like RCC1 family protein